MQKAICLSLVFICLFSKICASCCDCDIVYVINLDRNPERMSKMKKQLNKLGIKFKRFKAVDGYNIEIINTETGKLEDNKSFHKNHGKGNEYLVRSECISFKYDRNKRGILCCGELGCALSHLSVMKDIIKNNYRGAVIFEDDVMLEDNFKNILEETLRNSPGDADIIFLDVGVFYDYSSPYFVSPGALLNGFEQIPNNKYVVKLTGKSVYGMHAYFVTQNGAKNILKNSKFLEWPIDNHLMMCKCLPKYAARKKMLYISNEVSEICNMGRGFFATRDQIIDNRKN